MDRQDAIQAAKDFYGVKEPYTGDINFEVEAKLYSRGYADGLEAAAKIVDEMSTTGETNTAVTLREQAAKVRESDK